MNQCKETIMILGLGYLGQEIVSQLHHDRLIFGSHRNLTQHNENELPDGQRIIFDLLKPATWENLPPLIDHLVYSLPATSKDWTQEEQRLKQWLTWMKVHRPLYQRCVYISSTSVYPDRPGDWSEEAAEITDQNNGLLRWHTEQLFTMYFKTQIVRPGGIYGLNRNLLQRWREGKPLEQGPRLIHRIHVHDLARIVIILLKGQREDKIINAVDLLPSTTVTTLTWLLAQEKLSQIEKQKLSAFLSQWRNESADSLIKKVRENSGGIVQQRKINNHRLVRQWKFEFRYPSYIEGLSEMIY